MNVSAPAPRENMGRPEIRVDAHAKVTGAAKYASDIAVHNPAYAYFVTSAISRGRIATLDTAAALEIPGVISIMTHENRPELGEFGFFGSGGEGSTARPPLEDASIAFDGEIVAMVLADSYEAAREAAYAVEVEYDAEAPAATFDDSGAEIRDAAAVSKRHQDPEKGDASAAFAASEVKIEARYHTPPQHHNPIELFTTTCVWSGDELTIYEPSQFVLGLQNGLAKQIKVEPEKIKVLSQYVGGAFGSKGSITPRTSLVAIAARDLGRPVKLVMTREQGFTLATYRAETRHDVKLAAARDGKIKSYMHEAWEATSRADDYVVGGTTATSAMYAYENISTKVHVVKADRNTPGFMRSPAEVPYFYALESAIDELAVALNMDPVELRRINDTQVNPVTGAAYTSRSMMKCFDEAAEAFGWNKRNTKPGEARDGDWLIGHGCAMAAYPTQMAPSVARVRLDSQGKVRVQTASHDVGTGAYTVIGQMAAEMLGVEMKDVKVEMGDSRLPPGPVSGGSVTTASTCSAVKIACEKILGRLNAKTISEGKVQPTDGEALPLKDVFGKLNAGAVEETGEFVPKDAKPGDIEKAYKGQTAISGGPEKDSTQFAFGAEFVEVRVHSLTKEVRVSRIVGAFAGGRIMNTRTANSQLLGGMVWGISSALHEATELDHASARYINDNIAEYLVPVNADIVDVKIILVPEVDDKINPAGVKGIGELANVGTAAAVTNAVYNATGIRIRDLPIRIEKLLQA